MNDAERITLYVYAAIASFAVAVTLARLEDVKVTNNTLAVNNRALSDTASNFEGALEQCRNEGASHVR